MNPTKPTRVEIWAALDRHSYQADILTRFNFEISSPSQLKIWIDHIKSIAYKGKISSVTIHIPKG